MHTHKMHSHKMYTHKIHTRTRTRTRTHTCMQAPRYTQILRTHIRTHTRTPVISATHPHNDLGWWSQSIALVMQQLVLKITAHCQHRQLMMTPSLPQQQQSAISNQQQSAISNTYDYSQHTNGYS